MAKRPVPLPGEIISWERAFTDEEVRDFTRLSGDDGVQHVVPDHKGRIMVQGLLTMTLPTKIGGELDFIAAEMSFQFLRPVFVGQTIRCQLDVVSVVREEARFRLEIGILCQNPDGKEVLRGHTKGVILIK